MAAQKLVNIGFGNYVLAERVVSVVGPASSPMKRLREDARAEGRLIDATQGRRTKSVLVMENSQVVLSALLPETIAGRAQGGAEAEEE